MTRPPRESKLHPVPPGDLAIIARDARLEDSVARTRAARISFVDARNGLR
jgi:hypothetical protein